MAWRNRKHYSVPPFVAIDSTYRLKRVADKSNLTAEIKPVQNVSGAQKIFGDALPVLEIDWEPASLQKNTLTSIEKAVELAACGDAKAIVTNPINKKSLYDVGFNFQGHTDYLELLAREKSGISCTSVMMLASPQIRTVPVTVHIPLNKVSKAISEDLIISSVRIVSIALKQDFGISVPRIAVSGLNPHAGEDGALGREDETIIAPAVAKLREEGHQISGPLSADTMFHERARKTYDAAICMYHDQALIPIKTLDFDRGVNVTLGLPFIRTSPDHGTAEDIAGTGTVNPESFIEALKLADQLADHRAAYAALPT